MTLFRFLPKWIWPGLVLLGLLLIGLWISNSVVSAEEQHVEMNLQVILNAEVTVFRMWLTDREADAKAVANDNECVSLMEQSLKASEESDPSKNSIQILQEKVAGLLHSRNYHGFLVVDRDWKIVAANRSELVGKPAPAADSGWLDVAFAGNSTVCRPFLSEHPIRDEEGQFRRGVPTMFVVAPVKKDGRILAVLALRLRPDEDFSKNLTAFRFGESGESYAFDQTGLMLSQSRFDDQLKQIGILPDRPDARSILSVRITDPEVNLTEGEQLAVRAEDPKLTKMAELATTGNAGVNTTGYRDYRGVTVVGAWTWLPEYGMGIATEIDRSEILRPRTLQRKAIWTLYGLLCLLVITLTVGWFQSRSRMR